MMNGPDHSTKAHTSGAVIVHEAKGVMCGEMESSLHDALCVVKSVLG